MSKFSSKEETQANARLIAAAPKMYQYLKLILNGEFSSDDVEQLLARIDGEEQGMTEQLRPCPFCGGEAETRRDIDRFGVGCLNDECRGFIGLSWLYLTQGEAIEAWNRRVEHDKTNRQ